MDIILNILVVILILCGLFFFMVGTIGLIRLPDVFTRMHATTKCDTMGAGLIFIGLMIWQGFSFISLNIFIILLFIWLSNPTAAHFIAKTQYLLQQQQKEGDDGHS